MSHTTKGFSIAEPGDDDIDCALCTAGIPEDPHTIMEFEDLEAESWLSVPICKQCQVVVMVTLARDLAVDAGYDDTPQGVAEFMAKLDWDGRDPVAGKDAPQQQDDGGGCNRDHVVTCNSGSCIHFNGKQGGRPVCPIGDTAFEIQDGASVPNCALYRSTS